MLGNTEERAVREGDALKGGARSTLEPVQPEDEPWVPSVRSLCLATPAPVPLTASVRAIFDAQVA